MGAGPHENRVGCLGTLPFHQNRAPRPPQRAPESRLGGPQIKSSTREAHNSGTWDSEPTEKGPCDPVISTLRLGGQLPLQSKSSTREGHNPGNLGCKPTGKGAIPLLLGIMEISPGTHDYTCFEHSGHPLHAPGILAYFAGKHPRIPNAADAKTT